MDTFNILFKDTQLHNNDKIQEVRQNLLISIRKLKELCVKANFLCPFLLVDSAYVREISYNYEKRAYAGTDRTTVSIACGDEVDLADISLILRDIAHKQEVFNKIHKRDDCDVAILAFALQIIFEQEDKLVKDNAIIVANDKGVQNACDELGIKYLSTVQFKNVLTFK